MRSLLYYSSKDIGLTKRDLLRFMRLYRGKPLRETLTQEKKFWAKVEDRGNKLYDSEKRKAKAVEKLRRARAQERLDQHLSDLPELPELQKEPRQYIGK